MEEDDRSLQPYTRCTDDVAVQDPAWASTAATSLEHNGFCTLRLAVPSSLCEPCGNAMLSSLTQLLDAVRRHGVDPFADAFGFQEICKRHGGARFDMAAPLGNGSEASNWLSLEYAVGPVVKQVLSQCSSMREANVDRTGCVVSLPDAPDQGFHADGPDAGFINVFIPLTAVDSRNGTELVPGSHEPRDFAFGALPWQDESQFEPLTPQLAVGDILLFDYRLRHRGLANRTASPRPVAYLVYTRAGSSDTHNFPSKSVWVPTDNEESARSTMPL